jgi:hypothetical protein
MSGICCGVCYVELKKEDMLIMDDMNCLKHKDCYDLHTKFIKDEDTYQNIRKKFN